MVRGFRMRQGPEGASYQLAASPPFSKPLGVVMAFLRAREGFYVPSLRVTVKGGQVVAEDDPVTAGRAHLFEPLEGNPAVEQATRAPGEMRVGTRRDPAAVVARGEGPEPAKRSRSRKAPA